MTMCEKCWGRDIMTKYKGLDFRLIEVDDKTDKLPDDCPCYCEEAGCNWKGVLSDCETAIDSEGWEYPEYEVLVCPNCGGLSILFLDYDG